MSEWSHLPTRSVLNACHRHAAPHQVLKSLRVHPGSSLVAAVGMAAHVRSDVRHLHPVDLVAAVDHMVEPVLPVHRSHRHSLRGLHFFRITVIIPLYSGNPLPLLQQDVSDLHHPVHTPHPEPSDTTLQLS